jgi:mRNA interferase MazF
VTSANPRSALIIQSDEFLSHPTVTVLPISSYVFDAPTVRITIDPTSWNGLKLTSQIMIDKPMTTMREKVGAPFGRLDDETMLAATRSLALFLGFG